MLSKRNLKSDLTLISIPQFMHEYRSFKLKAIAYHTNTHTLVVGDNMKRLTMEEVWHTADNLFFAEKVFVYWMLMVV